MIQYDDSIGSYSTWVELQWLAHHVPNNGVLVGRLRLAHSLADAPPHERVPDQALVPAGRVLQQVPYSQSEQPLVSLGRRHVLRQDTWVGRVGRVVIPAVGSGRRTVGPVYGHYSNIGT